MQDCSQTEIRGLLRVLLVRHEKVPADAAVWRLLRLTGFTQLTKRGAEARVTRQSQLLEAAVKKLLNGACRRMVVLECACDQSKPCTEFF